MPGYPGPATVLTIATASDGRVIAALANSEAVLGLGCGQEGQWAVLVELDPTSGNVTRVYRDVSNVWSCILNDVNLGFSVLLDTPPAGSTGVPNGTTLWVVATGTSAQSPKHLVGVAGFLLEGQEGGNFSYLPSDWGKFTLMSLDYSAALQSFVALATVDQEDAAYIAITGNASGPVVLFTYPTSGSPGAVIPIAAGLTYLPPSAGGRIASSLVGYPDRSIGLSSVDLIAGKVTETRAIAQDSSVQQYLDILECV